MKPYKACLPAVEGLFTYTQHSCRIGLRFFDIWGKPKVSKIKTDKDEVNKIFNKAEEIYCEQTKEY